MPTRAKPTGPQLLDRFLDANRTSFPTDASFAEAIGCTAARLSQIRRGRGGPVKPGLAINIHRVTRGRVPGNVLLPGLWRRPSDVPVEVHQ